MVTVAELRAVLAEVEDDAEVVVEFPGTLRPVVGVSVRSTPADGVQLVVLADL